MSETAKKWKIRRTSTLMSMPTKSKRSANTSPEQFEQYLLIMETDSVFRTNTLNPTVPPHYIEKTWDKLINKLNACDSGPALNKNEWIKRFKDWKNSVRAKARKNIVSGKKTGGGPSEEIKLSPIEERALSVWGRVTITGSCQVPVSGGLQFYKGERPKSPVENLQVEEDLSNQTLFEERTSKQVEEELEEIEVVEEVHAQRDVSMTTTPNKKKRVIRSTPSSSRSVKVIGEEMLAEYKRNCNLEKEATAFKKKELELKIAQFKFEVAKYKFENPDFQFQCDL